MNELHRVLNQHQLKEKMDWSIIDRWATHPALIHSFVHKIKRGLQKWPTDEQTKVVLLFSAHSLPMKSVEKGDPYPLEVSSTVQRVMEELQFSNPYQLCWQSKVGPLPWLGPQTRDGLRQLAKQGKKNVLVVPIAFTSDHIETLFELDLDYGHEATKLGLNYHRTESLNDDPVFIQALAQIVTDHLQKPDLHVNFFFFSKEPTFFLDQTYLSKLSE